MRQIKLFSNSKKVIPVCLLALTLACGCQKGDVGMELVAEGFGGTKAAVDGLYSYWVNGETVRINGVNKTVVADGESAYITDVQESDIYRALYPDTLNSTAALNSDNVTVLIPRTYTYMEENRKQRLGVPMAAYGTSDNRLWFQHLTAAITVEIKNHYGFTIEVDSVVVESNLYQISGEKEITLAPSIDVTASSSDVAADKRVAVYFNGGTSLQILAGETRRVQVPVLPVGDDNHFTVKVGVHKVDDSDVKYLFNKTQGGTKEEHYALARRQMGYAGVTLGGVFSIGDNKKVIISQGNLQYVPSTGVWSFHTHQYDMCETGTVDSSLRYIAGGTLPIDLFGYGTSGYNNMHPYMTIKKASSYTAPTSSIAKTNYDWGWCNRIRNGGNTINQWYTLLSLQWDTIFMYRRPNTSGINNNNPTRYTYASIDGRKGIILFPDVYTHPSGISDLDGATFDNYSNFTATITVSDWQKMEAAGAVFLPAAGYRHDGYTNSTHCHQISLPNIGMYWTAHSSSSTKATRLRFSQVEAPLVTSDNRYYGMSVRVVKDI